jgi:hypothetical protein
VHDQPPGGGALWSARLPDLGPPIRGGGSNRSEPPRRQTKRKSELHSAENDKTLAMEWALG